MRKYKIKILAILLSFLFVFLGLYFKGIVEVAPSNPEYLDLNRIRSLASNETDSQALSLSYTKIARVGDWRIFQSDRKQCSSVVKSALSFRLAYADTNVIINTGINKKQYEFAINQYEWNDIDSALTSRALLHSDMILFSQPGNLWMNKLASDPSIYHTRDKIKVTPAQLNSGRMRRSGFPPAVIETIQPVQFNEMHVWLPGMVIIRPPNLPKDHQWFYIQLKGQREFLIVSCFVPSWSCIENARMPDRLWLWREGYEEKVSEALDWLHQVHQNENIHIIHACDHARLNSLARKSLLDRLE